LKEKMNIFTFTFLLSTVLCLSVAAMQAIGIAHPNCEPTLVGYAQFYAMLFGSVTAACALNAVGLAILMYLNGKFKFSK
jgi:hypothetical protein